MASFKDMQTTIVFTRNQDVITRPMYNNYSEDGEPQNIMLVNEKEVRNIDESEF
jgi:hypothetical protein